MDEESDLQAVMGFSGFGKVPPHKTTYTLVSSFNREKVSHEV